jgi:hypothetical protein
VLPRVEVLDEGVRGGAGGDEVFLPAAPGPGVGGVLHRPGRQETGIVGNREVVGYDEFVDQGVDVSVAATLQQSCDEVVGPFQAVAGQPGDQPVSGDGGGPLQLPDLLRGEDLGALRGGGADRRGQQGQEPPLLVLSQVSTQGGDGLAECCPDRRTVCLGEIVEDCDEVFKRLRPGEQRGQGVGIPGHAMNLSAMGDKSTRDHRRFAAISARISLRLGPEVRSMARSRSMIFAFLGRDATCSGSAARLLNVSAASSGTSRYVNAMQPS